MLLPTRTPIRVGKGAAFRLRAGCRYAIRVMIYLGARPGELCSIKAVADAFSISQNHLMKVAQDLAAEGLIESVRGRSGRIRISTPLETINLGRLLRHSEGLSELLECSTCVVGRAGGMPSILSEATAAFVKVFDKYSVADLVRRREQLAALPTTAA